MTPVGLFTIDAVLVDCEIVKMRKAEVNILSPADLTEILGPAALDESNASRSLKELLLSPSRTLPSDAHSLHESANMPSQKPSKKFGGRKRMALEDKSFFKIGRMVEQEVPRCERGFELLRRLRNSGITEVNVLQSELKKEQLSAVEIDSLLMARTPMGAAKRVVARSGSIQNKRTGLSLRTVHSSYSRYLKAKLSAIRTAN